MINLKFIFNSEVKEFVFGEKSLNSFFDESFFINLRNNRLIFNLYQIYKILIFYPFLGLTTVTIGTIFRIVSFFANGKTVQIGAILWARLNSYITPMFIKVKGKENIDPEQSYVVVANHQSQFDIFAVYGWLPVDFRWVMKMELKKVPVLGFYCDRAGHVYIDRSNHDAALKSIETAKKRIKKGTSIMFFPEGTRSDNGELLKFKKGAFKFALDMELPILPVTIKGTSNILPNNSVNLFPGRSDIIIHKPIPINCFNKENIQVLMDRAKESIENGLNN